MTDKKTRIPRDYAAIEKGALALALADRVQLAKELTKANQDEVERLQKQAAEAAGLLKG